MPSTQILTSFAVVGAGEVGLPIIQALASITPKPRHIIVLSRTPQKLPTLPTSVDAFQIDYAAQDEITRLLQEHDVDVVISALNYTAMEAQKVLADASKEADIKLFVPSEFGLPSEGGPEGIIKVNSDFAEYLKSIELPFTRYYIGLLYSWAGRLFGTDVNGRFNIVDRGDVPVTYTDVRDVAGFVAYSTTHLPLSKLSNASFRLSGQTIAPLDIAKIYNRCVDFVDAVPGPLGDFCTMIQKEGVQGHANVNWDWVRNKVLTESEVGGDNARRVWPGHEWIQLKDVPLP